MGAKANMYKLLAKAETAQAKREKREPCTQERSSPPAAPVQKHVEVAAPARPMMMERAAFPGQDESVIQDYVSMYGAPHVYDALAKSGGDLVVALQLIIDERAVMSAPIDTWTCTGCTFENASCMTWCEVCNEPKGVRKIKPARTVDLEEKGRLLGYKPVDVIGDGSCQFRSIIMALEEEEGKHNRGTEWTHLKLRQACVKWMREDGDLRMDQENNMGEETTVCQATWLDGKTWDEYLKDMERPTTWGDEGTLLVACVVLRARIGVISNLEASKGMYYTTPPAHWKIPEDRTLTLFHLHEDHYKYAKKL